MKIHIFHQADEKPAPESMGCIFPLVPPRKVNVKNQGEWNTFRIVMDWPNLQVWTNGEQIQNLDLESVRSCGSVCAPAISAWSRCPIQSYFATCAYANFRARSPGVRCMNRRPISPSGMCRTEAAIRSAEPGAAQRRSWPFCN
jgi:hypothetical protein